MREFSESVSNFENSDINVCISQRFDSNKKHLFRIYMFFFYFITDRTSKSPFASKNGNPPNTVLFVMYEEITMFLCCDFFGWLR